MGEISVEGKLAVNESSAWRASLPSRRSLAWRGDGSGISA